MTDDEFAALCEKHGFGAVARGEFPLIPPQMLRALLAAAVAQERERIKSSLIGMDEAAAGRHNYYAHAAWVLFERTTAPQE